jgi:hypothetical protein
MPSAPPPSQGRNHSSQVGGTTLTGDENFRKVSQNIDNMVKISRNIDITVKRKQVKIDARTL